jgi:hypothetical protein
MELFFFHVQVIYDLANKTASNTVFSVTFRSLFCSVISSIFEAMVSLRRIRSFLLCDKYHRIGPDSLQDIGIELDNVLAAYDTRRPIPEWADADPKTKELAERQYELSLLRSQLEDAESRIRAAQVVSW